MEDKNALQVRLLKVKAYLKKKGKATSQKEMAVALGISPQHMNDAFHDRNRKLTTGLMEKIADTFPDIFNKEWLVSGEGQMIKPSKNLRPHVQAKAAAGFMDGISHGEYGNDMRPMIPFLKDYDFTIEVSGRSMLPYYKEGDILACRISKDRNNPPIGKACVIDARYGAVVKEISGVNEDETAIICHSYNEDPKYKDYELEFEDINQIAVVVGSIRAEE